MTGYFLNFNRNDGDSKREEIMTLDALALGMHGLLATNYALSTHFTDLRTKPNMYGVALGGTPNQNLLRVDVDAPQGEMSVHALIEGTKFTKTGLGFGTSDTPLQLGQ